jgi:hypothetical protein
MIKGDCASIESVIAMQTNIPMRHRGSLRGESTENCLIVMEERVLKTVKPCPKVFAQGPQ